MTKPRKTLHQVVMMVSALVVTFITNLAFAGPGLNRFKEAAKRVWEGAKQLPGKGKEIYEKGGELYEESVELIRGGGRALRQYQRSILEVREPLG